MIRLEDPGEPLALIDVKCVISLLIKAEESNTERRRREGGGGGREGGREGGGDRTSHLFDGDGSPAADAVGSSLQAFLVLVCLVGLPRL